ncbi:hypothetical protein ACQKMV_15355 [Lysinibacillus sp. NPDC094403]|uniref:hypothetical protein n=1 Tax=Lysinibacillus sp. NPDC094403 TaxID=3390581 RepID=UPI003CFDB3F4
MHTALWNVIQVFNESERDNIDLEGLGFAKEILDEETFALLLEHLKRNIKITSEQWL